MQSFLRASRSILRGVKGTILLLLSLWRQGLRNQVEVQLKSHLLRCFGDAWEPDSQGKSHLSVLLWLLYLSLRGPEQSSELQDELRDSFHICPVSLLLIFAETPPFPHRWLTDDLVLDQGKKSHCQWSPLGRM